LFDHSLELVFFGCALFDEFLIFICHFLNEGLLKRDNFFVLLKFIFISHGQHCANIHAVITFDSVGHNALLQGYMLHKHIAFQHIFHLYHLLLKCEVKSHVCFHCCNDLLFSEVFVLSQRLGDWLVHFLHSFLVFLRVFLHVLHECGFKIFGQHFEVFAKLVSHIANSLYCFLVYLKTQFSVFLVVLFQTLKSFSFVLFVGIFELTSWLA